MHSLSTQDKETDIIDTDINANGNAAVDADIAENEDKNSGKGLEKEIKEYDIPSFFGEISPKKKDVKAEKLEYNDFFDNQRKETESKVEEPELEDFSQSLDQLFSRLREEKTTEPQPYEETGITQAADLDFMFSKYEKNSQHQGEVDRLKSEAEQAAADIVAKARQEAEGIAQKARDEAWEEGFRQGLADGTQRGCEQAYNETQNKIDEETALLLSQLQQEIENVQAQRENIFRAQIGDMRDLSIAIAEKIINVSLKSSNEIVEKMIISATEKLKNVQWAKLYLSQKDFDVTVSADIKILNAVKRITENVKVEIMENKPSGTCIIELPDQIIDASVDAQINQVKNILGKR